jgi:SAM-dependent methyltransferase
VGTTRLLDVGCGRGYFLSRVAAVRPEIELVGCDVVDKLAYSGMSLTCGSAEALPFGDASFDVVTCSHTLEHILNPAQAVSELKRVAKNSLFVAVPCQRYYFYTLDEHVNFYPQKEILLAHAGSFTATFFITRGSRPERRARAPAQRPYKPLDTTGASSALWPGTFGHQRETPGGERGSMLSPGRGVVTRT